MLEFEGKVKKWGNSLGLVIPDEKVKSEHLTKEDELHVIALRKNESMKEMFGLLPKLESGQKAKDRLRKELYD